MKSILALLVALPLLLSCQTEQKPSLLGTWHQERDVPEEPGFTISIDGMDMTDELHGEDGNDDGKEHFYLRFQEDGQMTEYKVGFGLRRSYEVRDGVIYSEGEPLYEVVSLTGKALTIKQPGESGTATYLKTSEDLAGLPVIN